MNINKTMFICLLLLSLIVSSFNGVSIRSNTTCVESITLTYFFPPPTISAQLSSDSIVHSVTIDDLPVTHETDQPCLPVKPLRVLLPNGLTVDDVTVEIDQTPLVISSINPIKGSHLLQINTISENTDTSKNSSDQSKDLFSIIGIFTLKGYSILYLTLHPVIYDENSQQLTYHPRLTVTIRMTQSSASKTIRGLQSDKDQVGSIVENPYIMQTYEPTISHLNSISSATYLVITNRQLLNSGLEDTFQFLIQSKIDKGISARIVTVEDILDDASFSVNGTWGDNNPSNPFYQMPITEHFERFDDTSARIRNYIRYAYMELGTEYVLLGGDADITNESQNIIPARGLFANESGLPLISHGITLAEEEDDIPSDVYYACLDGTFNYDMDEHFGESKDRNDITLIDEADLLSEISVGRA
ncbi:MAG: C25 family cysteine peptidase, partial [Thermoplasmatota archaeon]